MNKESRSMGTNASVQIDAIIASTSDWRGKQLAQLRAIIQSTDRDIIESVKWKKPSRPEGVAVWEYYGNLCMADILKNAVRLTFPKGAAIVDPKSLFNARLDSKGVRAIDVHESDSVDSAGLQAIVRQAIKLNAVK